LNIYIAPLRDSEALPILVSAITSIQGVSEKGEEDGRVRSTRHICWGCIYMYMQLHNACI